MTARLVPEAEEELRAAAKFYAEVRMELAERFLGRYLKPKNRSRGTPSDLPSI